MTNTKINYNEFSVSLILLYQNRFFIPIGHGFYQHRFLLLDTKFSSFLRDLKHRQDIIAVDSNCVYSISWTARCNSIASVLLGRWRRNCIAVVSTKFFNLIYSIGSGVLAISRTYLPYENNRTIKSRSEIQSSMSVALACRTITEITYDTRILTPTFYCVCSSHRYLDQRLHEIIINLICLFVFSFLFVPCGS